MNSYYKRQEGFTLVELMIALVLGLLISAAALQIFYTSSLSGNIQKAGSNVVETSTFGFDYLTKQIRKANYGAVMSGSANSYFLNAETPQGGIVLTAPTDLKYFGKTYNTATPPVEVSKDSNLRGLNLNTGLINTNLLSTNSSSLSSSNVEGLQSDQLTIQYKTYEDAIDCEGRNVKGGDYVIERYFVRPDGNSLSLACASAIYTYDKAQAQLSSSNQNGIDISKYDKPDGSKGTSNLAGNGEVIIPNIDYFRVNLGVTEQKNFAIKPEDLTLENIPIPTDPYATLATKRIVNVQIALLVRSAAPVTASADSSFTLLDKSGVKLNASANKDGKMRRVLQSTILIRNARGAI